MNIGTREIGSGKPVYIIAELGVNHDGSVERALDLVDAAAEAGADAIKLQYFEADRLMSRAAKLAAYQKAAGESDPIEMLRRLELSLDGMARIIERAHGRNIHAIVTVFSVELVEAAQTFAWDAYKSASPDIIHRPLLEAMAATGKPLIVSTGASTEEEILRAREWLGASARERRLAFLQCVSSYPTRDEDASLGGIAALARLDIGGIGYSDHTTRVDTGHFAVALGASILEKHLTSDRAAQGPDHSASLDAGGFATYCSMARRRDRASAAEIDLIGPREKRVLDCETDVRTVSRQSVVATADIPKGTRITREMLTFKRPGIGIAPFRVGEVLDRTAARAIAGDTLISPEDLR